MHLGVEITPPYYMHVRKVKQLRDESYDIKEDYANLIRTLSS